MAELSPQDEGLVADFEAAAAATAAVLRQVGAKNWDRPTPCEDWTVGTLVAHLVTGNRLFVTAFIGGAPSDQSLTANMASEEYDRSIVDLTEAFRQPGSLDRPVAVPLGTVPGRVAVNLRITELLAHGWDLARALGLNQDWPDEVVEHAIDFTGPALAIVPAEDVPVRVELRVTAPSSSAMRPPPCRECSDAV